MKELIRALRRGELSGHVDVGGRTGKVDSIGGEAGLRYTTPDEYYFGGSVRGSAADIPGGGKVVRVTPGAFDFGRRGNESEQRLRIEPTEESIMLQFGWPRIENRGDK
tara:strand:- start:270 stop:593 length:324 start_codon:yes stop_codon:yes gene_type:complete